VKVGTEPVVELPSLDWSSATVKDGTLTVGLTGERPKGWKKSFDRTAKLLGRGDWAEVECKRGKVRVSGIEPGTEERLRAFLEGVVAQADAEHRPDDEGDEDDDAGGSEDTESGDGGSEDDPDAQLTERFRSFSD
jgi:hypothetical protein